jgi:hypothetical protein
MLEGSTSTRTGAGLIASIPSARVTNMDAASIEVARAIRVSVGASALVGQNGQSTLRHALVPISRLR